MLIPFITYLFKIIKFLCEHIDQQSQKIHELEEEINAFKKYSKKPQFDKPADLDFQKLTIDKLPKVVKAETVDYRQLLQEKFQLTGKPIKPIVRHGQNQGPAADSVCPHCGAPQIYLYQNNGAQGQLVCKICGERFIAHKKHSKDIELLCPHCERRIYKIKTRKDFDIYRCPHTDCPYYQKRLSKLSKKERKLFKSEPNRFKMRYIYRQFHLKLADLEQDSDIPTRVNLNNIHSSPQVLGLILTYHVNYGMSAEKTAALMYDVHQVKISGQTIRNYARSVAAYVRPFTDHYPYQLSDQFCGDETYIRVSGKWHYIYFFFDATNKIILSHRVSPHRDTKTAIQAIFDVIRRLDPLPADLNLIMDGNPIYKLAQAFFKENGFPFKISQVIGLTNEDEVSRQYRPLKQIIERLNRTFKGNYKMLGGFNSDAGSIAHVALFTTYFNFLRPHSKLKDKHVPVQIPELKTCADMPQKWLKLLELTEKFLTRPQPA